MMKLLRIGTFFLKSDIIRKSSFWKKFLRYTLTTKPLVYWYSRVYFENKTHENFGDIITPYIVEKLTGLKPVLFRPTYELSLFFKHYIMTGSIIGESRKKSVVWGSGIMNQNQKIKDGNFLAVRGPRTAKRIKELGFNEPVVYGDPALLLPRLFKPNFVKKEFRIGIIPHYVDYDAICEIVASSAYRDVKVIDLLTNDIEEVVNQIVLCDKIISTSLHGIIVANAYQIPTVWWKFSDKLMGDDVKFYDYFESVTLFGISPVKYTEIDELLATDQFFLPEYKNIEKLQNGLLESFPLRKKNNI